MRSCRYAYVLVALGVAGSLALVAGCGGGGGDAPVVNAEVEIKASITAFTTGAVIPADTAAAPAANQIETVVVETTDPNDTFAITDPAATFTPAGGAAQPVALTPNGARNKVTLAAVTCTPSTTAFNTIAITSPVTIHDAQSNTQTTINLLRFQFECLADGTVVSPDELTVSIPTSGKAQDQRIICTGLPAGTADYVRTQLWDNQGGLTSKVKQSDSNGRAVMQDVHGNLTAALLNGGTVALSFARTNGNANPLPDLLE